MQRAFVRTACLLSSSCLGGCILPYAVPRVDYTPAVTLDAPTEEVRVFCVDMASWRKVGVWQYERLSELSVTNTDATAAQVKPSLTHGVFIFAGALNHHIKFDYSVALRVYRPGFELAEIEPWERAKQINWIPAPELDAQDAVLDRLFPLDLDDLDDRDDWDDWSVLPYRNVGLGSESTAHRKALLFGADEYDRLAAIAVLPEDRGRLTAKASRLRKRAEE